jgi:hypothetical protein
LTISCQTRIRIGALDLDHGHRLARLEEALARREPDEPRPVDRGDAVLPRSAAHELLQRHGSP